MAYLIKPKYEQYADRPKQKDPDAVFNYAPAAPPPGPEAPNTQAGPSLEGGNGRWINFSRYWNQNQNGAQDMATGLGNDAENRAQDAQIRGQNALTNHASAVQKGMVKDEGIIGGGPYLGGGVTKQRAEELANASYTGPTSLTDAQLDSTYGRAAMGIQNLQSVNGQQAELQQKAKGTYGQGASLLDAGLTQTAGGERFAGLKQRYSGLMDQLEKIKTQAGEASAKGAADSVTNAHMYQDRLGQLDEAERAEADRVAKEKEQAGADEDVAMKDFYAKNVLGSAASHTPYWNVPTSPEGRAYKAQLDAKYGPGTYDRLVAWYNQTYGGRQ